MKHCFSVATLALSFLAGCASSANEGTLRWEDGWRKGVVTTLGQGAAFSEHLAANCKAAQLPTPQTARYVTIRIRKNSSPNWLTVPVPVDARMSVDDRVYVNVLSCGVQVVHAPG
jgi:hypothetical protein